ncbi:Uncharacterized protein Rs2_14489 [Raphanus sativus]|uniref:Uncharacterized protein LOC130510787 n=1 Tax=Raphanus sativus TaxID=3726 RepID=A0A9W3DIH1_RAPSA|nr:uncharacterized protein LOC130510787 [Raphanus sativus]KAJ4900538.1 Uncharacterized protein Rs2_14489 [Raphanus sativus]
MDKWFLWVSGFSELDEYWFGSKWVYGLPNPTQFFSRHLFSSSSSLFFLSHETYFFFPISRDLETFIIINHDLETFIINHDLSITTFIITHDLTSITPSSSNTATLFFSLAISGFLSYHIRLYDTDPDLSKELLAIGSSNNNCKLVSSKGKSTYPSDSVLGSSRLRLLKLCI